MVGRRWARHDIIALGQNTRSDYVWRGMTSSPLDSIHGRTTSCVACNHRPWQHTNRMTSGVPYHHNPWMASTVERRRAWNAIIAFGQHTRSNDVRRGIPSWPWTPHTVKQRRAWHDITALGLHALSDDVGCGMTLPPLNSTHGRTMSGVECHHRPWTTRMVERRRAWHDITTLGQHR